ncbi:MAG TPA: hypothetical protein EYP74_01035 [Anaerolineales bacterium]|nr:hypothetical protein [Anaerolineales bacterium]
MQTGMMWFDDDKKTTLNAKIKTAAIYYRKKYGKTPDLCMVNPSMIPDDHPKDEKMTLRPYPHIVKGHLWIGIDDSRYKRKI